MTIKKVETTLMPNHLRAVATGFALVLTLAGCGSGDGPGRQADASNTINYGSYGTKADIDCGKGRSLNVGGSNNTLKVVGSCLSVTVGGADNAITLERVEGELSVVGLNNTVSYKAGDPTVDDSGTGNRIERR